MRSRLANSASERLATALADEPIMTEEEVMRTLSRIARSGKPGDRLRAAELLGKQLGMFREKSAEDSGPTLAELILGAQRQRKLPVRIAEAKEDA